MKVSLVITDATLEELYAVLSNHGNNPTVATNPTQSSTVVKKRKYAIPFKAGTKEYQKALRQCIKRGVTSYNDVLYENGNSIVNTPLPSNQNEPHWKQVIAKSVKPDHSPRLTEG